MRKYRVSLNSEKSTNCSEDLGTLLKSTSCVLYWSSDLSA